MKLCRFRIVLCLALLLAASGPGAVWRAPARAQEAPPGEADRPGEEADAGAAEQAEAPSREDSEEYYQLLKLFVDTLDQVDRNYVKDTSRRELMEAAIRGMLAELDQYSNYIPPQDLGSFKSGVENEFGGIGIQIGVRDGKLTIISPLVGTPAYRAGLMAGDQILRIEGKNTEGMSIDRARELLTGEVGAKVTFTVRHPHNQKTETVTLTREVVHVWTVMGYRRKDDDSWDFTLDPQEQISYIRLNAFGRRTADELREALEALESGGLRALVLDLRFNPGGLLGSAIEVSDLFVASGRIVSTEGRNAVPQVWDATPEGSHLGFPLAVLVNRASASASEIVAACLQDHQRGAVVGERTWGKGSVQNIIELENGKSALKLTTAGYRRPNGKNIHRFPDSSEEDDWGVRPDDGLEVKLTELETTRLYLHLRNREVLRRPQAAPAEAEDKPGEDQEERETVREFTDTQLQKALDYLRSQLREQKPQAADADAEVETPGRTSQEAPEQPQEQPAPGG